MSFRSNLAVLLVLLATAGCGSTVKYPSVRANTDIPPPNPTPCSYVQWRAVHPRYLERVLGRATTVRQGYPLFCWPIRLLTR